MEMRIWKSGDWWGSWRRGLGRGLVPWWGTVPPASLCLPRGEMGRGGLGNLSPGYGVGPAGGLGRVWHAGHDPRPWEAGGRRSRVRVSGARAGRQRRRGCLLGDAGAGAGRGWGVLGAGGGEGGVRREMWRGRVAAGRPGGGSVLAWGSLYCVSDLGMAPRSLLLAFCSGGLAPGRGVHKIELECCRREVEPANPRSPVLYRGFVGLAGGCGPGTGESGPSPACLGMGP